jgi:hypothetical protein
VLGGRAEHLGGPLLVRVDRPRDEAPIATDSGLNGWSTDPNGVDFVTLPSSDVGEYCPFVNP